MFLIFWIIFFNIIFNYLIFLLFRFIIIILFTYTIDKHNRLSFNFTNTATLTTHENRIFLFLAWWNFFINNLNILAFLNYKIIFLETWIQIVWSKWKFYHGVLFLIICALYFKLFVYLIIIINLILKCRINLIFNLIITLNLYSW